MAGSDAYRTSPNSAQSMFGGKGGEEKVHRLLDRSRPYFELLRRVEGEFGSISEPANYSKLPKELQALFECRRVEVEKKLMLSTLNVTANGVRPALDIGNSAYKEMLAKRYPDVVVEHGREAEAAAIREAQRLSDEEFERSYLRRRNGGSPAGNGKVSEQKIREMHADGKTVAEMAAECNLHPNTFYPRLRKMGLQPNRPARNGPAHESERKGKRAGRRKVTDEQLITAQREGKTVSEMAALFGIGQNWVRVLLNRLELEPNRPEKRQAAHRIAKGRFQKITNEQLIAAHEAGKMPEEIASEYRMSRWAVYSRMRKLELMPNRRKAYSDEQITDAISRGLTAPQARKEIGISHQVYRKRAGELELEVPLSNGGVSDDEIIAAFRLGGTQAEMGNRVGLTQGAMSARVRKLGLVEKKVRKPRKELADEDYKDAHARYIDQEVGYRTQREVANTLGVVQTTVSNRWSILGLATI
ncbi:MAG: hypothetical protein KGH69_03895 [Candidatus Micrarchaeota archaeon]|nr:hypothetical protein [Candidatus Micrarchaeota archaeon]